MPVLDLVELTKGAVFAKKMEALTDKASEEAMTVLRKAILAQMLK